MKQVLHGMISGSHWSSPLRPLEDVARRLVPTRHSLLLSYGLEGYLVEAVDVCVGVEALIFRCCTAVRLAISEAQCLNRCLSLFTDLRRS